MIEIKDKTLCTGCGACLKICPKKCIELIEDQEGFLYPFVRRNECIDCGMCDSVCHLCGGMRLLKYPNAIFAYRNDDKIRINSTSGGFFTAISEWLLNQEAAIYGAVFDDTFTVVHSRAINRDERDKQRYSKYVQSSTCQIIDFIQEDLKHNKKVLFVGTPCQVAGVLSYLEKKKISLNNLYTCDFVCHGVSSPVIWKEYLKYVKEKYNDEIIRINFRSKDIGWHTPQLKIEMRKHVQALTEKQDAFYQLFYSNCILRPSCHYCKYAKRERVSDFTMADCWGIEKSHPELDDNKGLSLVFTNTEKASEIVSLLGLKQRLSFNDFTQPHLSKSAPISKKREKFWAEYTSKGGKYVIEKYGNIKLYRKIVKFSKKTICKLIGR